MLCLHDRSVTLPLDIKEIDIQALFLPSVGHWEGSMGLEGSLTRVILS